MKTLLLAALLAVGLCTVSSLEAQTTTTTTAAAKTSRTSRNNSTATATGTISRRNSRFVKKTPPTAPFAIQPNQVDGVVPRAIRSGNPLQMINPFAPAAYGDGRDVTRREPSDPFQRPEGIKLVTVEF